jgi:signal transduction histidine kinase
MSLFSKLLPGKDGSGLDSTQAIAPDPTKQLSQQINSFGQILQNIKEGVITTNDAGIVTWANKAALESLKTTWSIAQNKPIGQVLPNIEKQIGQPKIQVSLTTLDGDTIAVNVAVFPLTGSNGESSGKLYILRDVSEEVTVEEMKVDFVAISAHQLRTPLTSVKGYLSVLAGTAIPKLDPQEKVFLERAIVSTNRLGSLIENLLNVSRIEKGALKVNFAPVNIEEVVKLAVANLMENARQNNVKLETDLRYSPYPTISGDASLLGEALTNIISNAIKYNHPAGNVNVSLEKQPEGGILIHITDTGKGIPAEALPHLFERFYAGTSSLSELSNGLGLGLFISKSIIDAHKGTININSLEGRGTTVSILLPLGR